MSHTAERCLFPVFIVQPVPEQGGGCPDAAGVFLVFQRAEEVFHCFVRAGHKRGVTVPVHRVEEEQQCRMVVVLCVFRVFLRGEYAPQKRVSCFSYVPEKIHDSISMLYSG